MSRQALEVIYSILSDATRRVRSQAVKGILEYMFDDLYYYADVDVAA